MSIHNKCTKTWYHNFFDSMILLRQVAVAEEGVEAEAEVVDEAVKLEREMQSRNVRNLKM